MKNSRIKLEDKGLDIEITCKICGEKIDHSNEFGTYCKNECGLEDDIKAKEKIEKLLGKFFKL